MAQAIAQVVEDTQVQVVPQAIVSSTRKNRIAYIDNLRILMIVLVVTIHIGIIYGNLARTMVPIRQPPSELLSLMLLWYAAWGRAFVTSLLFFIAGYFTPGSYDRRGSRHFIGSRLLRLGLPLLFYDLIIEPVVNYLGALIYMGIAPDEIYRSYGVFFKGLGSGPAWFILDLLAFSLVYVVWRQVSKPRNETTPERDQTPNDLWILLIALLMGICTYLIRLWFPVNWAGTLNFRLPYYAQSVSMFVVGIIAYRRNWFVNLSPVRGRIWLFIGIVFTSWFPVLMFLGTPQALLGGQSWVAMVYAVWEAFVCVGMSIGLLTIFRERLNHQGKTTRWMSREAFTVYLIHVPVIFAINLVIIRLDLNALVLFLLVCLLAVPLTFSISYLINRIPPVRKVMYP